MLYYLYFSTLIQSPAAAKHLHHALADWSPESAGPAWLFTPATSEITDACSSVGERSKWAQAPNAFIEAEEPLAIRQKISWDPYFFLLQHASPVILGNQ